MHIDYKIKQPVALVFDHLADMQKFVSVHPVIYRIESLGENKYLIYETLKFAFIPYSFTYTATVDSNKETNSVVMNATVMKNKIEMIFHLTSGDGFCLVEEKVTVKTSLLIKSMMQKIFRKHHAQLFRNIENVGGTNYE